MRTTVTLDEDLAAQLKELARRTRRPFKAVLNDAIRKGLESWNKAAVARPFRVRARDCGLRPGLDDRQFNQLADELAVEGAAQKLAGGR